MLEHIPIESIRNFSIIAHIDHGKSTLADRILEFSNVINERNKKNQILDSMDLERERGITIKSNSASFIYKEKYLLNLIDTPGHVDFSYEVFRSLAACEGVLLLIDASQGIQAQTLANFNLALEADLMIIPVINKIDLPNANVERTLNEIENTLGLSKSDTVCISAKTGLGIKNLIEAIITQVPHPMKPKPNSKTRALIFDAYFDPYRGVIEKIRILEGSIKKNNKIKFIKKNITQIISEIGINQINFVPLKELSAGQVGYIVTGIKNVADVTLGDTITLASDPAEEAIIKFKEIKPMVFSGLFPINGDDYEKLKEAIEKLALNDAALQFEVENSQALGFGYRVGYLGLLHLEIVQQRLEREFFLDLLSTAPSVKYKVHLKHSSDILMIDNPSKLPEVQAIDYIEEPYVRITIITPQSYLGNILDLLQEKRGENVNLNYLDSNNVEVVYLLPLSEMIFEFYDELKSISKGYASLDYEINSYKKNDLVKLDILVHNNKVDALAMILHRSKAETYGRKIIDNLKTLISKHQFQIALQAVIGSKIIARENISALRKNVTAKCYGGDITRKRKLLEKQKSGKKKMKMIGSVEIPQEAFLAVLKK